MVLARNLGLLAIYMYREDTGASLKKLDELYNELPPEARDELKDTYEDMKAFIRAGQWDDAWDKFQVLVDVIGKYDPVISAYVPKETYEAYRKAATPEETMSWYARKVLEGERVPAVPSDGIVAQRRVMEAVREAEGEPDYLRRIREHIEAWRKPADWEIELQELTKPVEVDWVKRLKQYRGGESG